MEALIGKARDTKDKLQELFTAKDKKTLVFTEKAGNACDIYRNRALLTSDGDKGYIQELLKDLQPREWISRERGPRFWVGVLPEWRSLPPGHNTTQGTLFVFSYGTADKKLIAMGRVQTIHIGAESPKSCELKQNSKQKFSLELCLNQNSEDVPGGGLRFVASGRSLPPISGEKVLSVVKVTREGRLTYTSVMSGDDADHWSACGTWLSDVADIDSSGDVENVENEDLSLEEREEGLCCRCLRGWWDDDSGKSLVCSGQCGRAFHGTCMDYHDLKNGSVICTRCTGEDDAVCQVCDKEWYSDERKGSDGSWNEFYTGAMLACQDCELWFHQECHDPKIEDKYISNETPADHDIVAIKKKATKKGRKGNKKDKKWHCAACKPATGAMAAPQPAAAPEPAAAAAPEPAAVEEPAAMEDHDVSAPISGPALIGARIKVFWPEEKKWYTGFVQAYIAEKHEHTVLYSDGDKIDEELDDTCDEPMQWELLEPASDLAGSLSARKRSNPKTFSQLSCDPRQKMNATGWKGVSTGQHSTKSQRVTELFKQPTG